jgi:prophage tail gpP-like protein
MNHLELLWEGTPWVNWLEYEVASDLDRPAASFTVRARPRADIATPATPGGTVELRVGGTTVLWGRVESVTTRRDAEQVELEVSGRDAGGLLSSASADYTWRWRQTPLSIIAAEVSTYAGLVLDPVLDFDPVIKRSKAEAGESCWSLLHRLADAQGMRLWIDPGGALHIGQYVTYDKARAQLRRRRRSPESNNILRSTVHRRFRDSYSEVTVLAERGDGGSHARWKGSWIDLTAPFFRPRVSFAEASNRAQADDAARIEGTKAQAERFAATYEVRGHLDGTGQPWAPNTLVEIDDVDEGLAETLLVVGRTFRRSVTRGTVTQLRLAQPGAFSA